MLFNTWKFIILIVLVWQRSHAWPFKTCLEREIDKRFETLRSREKEILENNVASRGGVEENVFLSILEEERKALRYQTKELENILTLRSDIKCIRVLDTCERRFELFQDEGSGNCLLISLVYLDLGSLNGFASFVPKGIVLRSVTFEGWSSSLNVLEEILQGVFEAVLDRDFGFVTLEDIVNPTPAEIMSRLHVPGLCTINMSNTSVVMIPHPTCEIHQTEIQKAYVINLKGQSARFSKFMEKNKNYHDFPPFERFDALNGRRHAAITPAMKRLFRYPSKNSFMRAFLDHNFRRGAIGCALTHLIIWQEMVLDESLDELDSYLIFEDDTVLVDGFTDLWHSRWTNSNIRVDARWDAVFLSTSFRNKIYPESPVWPYVNSFDQVGRSDGFGTYAYLIRKKGARMLLNSARRTGLSHPIDIFMFHLSYRKEIRTLEYIPNLANVSTATSSTHDPYVYSERKRCLLWTESRRASLHSYHISSMTIGISYPITDAVIFPDSAVSLNARLDGENNVSKFQAENMCLEVCYALQPIVSRSEPKDVECFFAFDNQKEAFLDTGAVVAEAKGRGGKVTIHAAAIGYDGKVIPNSSGESVDVFIDLQWLEIVQKDDSFGSFLLVSGEASLEVFLSKHGSDILCLEGYKPCVHLASLPRILEVIEYNQACTSGKFTIHSLDGSPPILETSFALPNFLDSVEVDLKLKSNL